MHRGQSRCDPRPAFLRDHFWPQPCRIGIRRCGGVLVPLEVFADLRKHRQCDFNPEDGIWIFGLPLRTFAEVRYFGPTTSASSARSRGKWVGKTNPSPTGDMVSMNWNGKRKRWIFGQRKQGGRSASFMEANNFAGTRRSWAKRSRFMSSSTLRMLTSTSFTDNGLHHQHRPLPHLQASVDLS